jgi:hypothetical protein
MNRLFLVVTCLASLAGCVDQDASTTSVDQNSTTTDPPPGSGPYSTIFPVHWDPKVNTHTSAFWDLGTGLLPHPSSHMTYLVNVGVPAVTCPTPATACPGATPGTKMVWLVSNERVYRTWEVDNRVMAMFNANLDDAIGNVKAMAGGSAASWSIVTGTDTKPPKGPGPHAWPIRTIETTFTAVNQFRALDLGGIQDSQLQVPPVTTAP